MLRKKSIYRKELDSYMCVSVTILACVTQKMLKKEMLDHLNDVEQYYR